MKPISGSASPIDRALLVIGGTTAHLGLFDDLDTQARLDVLVFPGSRSFAQKVASRVSPYAALSMALRGHRAQSNYSRVFVLDSALFRLDARSLDRLRQLSTGGVSLLLLNSVNAGSLLMQRVREKLAWFSPEDVYSFDEVDALDLGYQVLPASYYSHQQFEMSSMPSVDCYFAGGVKHGRGQQMLELVEFLEHENVDAQFDCNLDAAAPLRLIEHPNVRTLTNGWMPYSEVLERSSSARCLLEILQEGQHAQTLRYFEAVTLNRLLLTNNERIVDLPFYDPKYMKVFQRVEDIDTDWVREAPLPDYAYVNEFSPLKMPVFQRFVDE